MVKKIKIIFLGTSANIPSASRNHSGTLLVYNEENILVDCGEGIQRQFRTAKLNPCKVTRILITHKHLDHILGLPGLLATFSLSGYNKTLFIYGPKGIKKFLDGILDALEFKREYKVKIEEVSGKFFESNDFYLEAEAMNHRVPCNAYNFILKEQRRINKEKLLKSKLPAGPLLQKIKQGKNVFYQGKKYSAKRLIYLEEGKKISFVLDTSFHKKIIKFAENADVFVCESSFSEDMKNHAKEHLHLTSKQAGEIAKKAKVKKLFLTHISQRYEKNAKPLLDDAKKIFKNIKIAKDFDVVEV
ncbi:MAG: ribonuclease Z [archaeon]